mgnify:CR=1 FL=1
MTEVVLETRDLRRRHGTGREVIAGISFVLHANESVALIGPSGCGKTTFLQMVGLLDRPTTFACSGTGSAGFGLRAGGAAFYIGHVIFIGIAAISGKASVCVCARLVIAIVPFIACATIAGADDASASTILQYDYRSSATR